MCIRDSLDTVTIAASGNNVTIAAAIPEATLNQVIGIITALMAAEAGGVQPGPEPTPAPAPQ